MAIGAFGFAQILSTHQGAQKVGVGGDCDRLGIDKRNGDPIVGKHHSATRSKCVQLL